MACVAFSGSWIVFESGSDVGHSCRLFWRWQLFVLPVFSAIVWWGGFHLNEKRRWLYPIFLAFVDVLPGPGWTAVPLIQHVIGLFTVLGIGWCSAQLAIRPLIVVPLVTALAAIWPRTLWYEHEFIAESLLLAAFVAVLALLLTPGIVRSRFGLFALMFAFAILAGMKGSGRFLWMGSVMSLFLLHQNPRRWLWGKLSLVMAAISIFFVATIGKSAQGDWLALSSDYHLCVLRGALSYYPLWSLKSLRRAGMVMIIPDGQNF